jgi:hypothetical protein
VADVATIAADVDRIRAAAGWPAGALELRYVSPSDGERGPGAARARIDCASGTRITIDVRAPKDAWASTLYFGVHRLGFLFPHPRWQVSPRWHEARRQCGKVFAFEPRLRYRGFHLHTQHPSEWIPGFLTGEAPEIGREFLRWSARNFQNLVQVQLLRGHEDRMWSSLTPLIGEAHRLGLLFGVSLSFAMQQQRAYRLIPLLEAKTGWGAETSLRAALSGLLARADFDYWVVELGSTEFTSTSATSTLRWIAVADELSRARGRSLFVKIHVSSNQSVKDLGNFNFLPSRAPPTVGVLPHTVMFYGLNDGATPMYGRRDFSDMRQFLAEEARRRPTWYYPETSYFIALDIDVPLFLTDYLVARSADMDLLEREGVVGQVNFTTGQELGYWLFDWTVALLALADYRSRPTAGLELLGEDVSPWRAVLDFQTEFIKRRQLIRVLSAANLQDEWPWGLDRIHERTLLSEVRRDPEALRREIADLEAALAVLPDISAVRRLELRRMLGVTWLRFEHALELRRALLHQGRSSIFYAHLRAAKDRRREARAIMNAWVRDHGRYPEAGVFVRHENWTSYPFGYGWPAAELHFWRREEGIVEFNVSQPFFENIFNPLRILF